MSTYNTSFDRYIQGEPIVWETGADWDAAQSQTGVHHQQLTGTDWAASSVIEKGYRPVDETGSSLVAYYTYDEDSGTTAYDAVGSNDGTLQDSAVQGASGVLGTTCYEISADDQHIVQGSPNITKTGDFTVSAWLNLGSIADGEDAIWISWEGGSGADLNFFASTTNGSATNQTRFFDYGNELLVGSDIRNAGWVHVAVTRVGNDYFLYEDGVQVDSKLGYGDLLASQTLSTERLGDGDQYGDHVYHGKIDEVRIHNRGLSESEIQTLRDIAL